MNNFKTIIFNHKQVKYIELQLQVITIYTELQQLQ